MLSSSVTRKVAVLLTVLVMGSLAAACKSVPTPAAAPTQVEVPDLPTTSPTTHYCAGVPASFDCHEWVPVQGTVPFGSIVDVDKATYPNGVNVSAELLCNMVSNQDLVAAFGPGAYRTLDGFTCRLQAANQGPYLDAYIGVPGVDHWYQTAMSFAKNDPNQQVERTTIAGRSAVTNTDDVGAYRSVYLAIPSRQNAVVVLNLHMSVGDTAPDLRGREQAIVDNRIAPLFVEASAR